MKSIRHWVRLLMLAAMACSVTLVAGRLIFYPAQPKVANRAFAFPEQVGLTNNSNPIQSEPLTFESDMPKFFVSGHRYRYQHDSWPVEVEMRYLIYPNADLMELIQVYLQPQQGVQRDAITIKQSPDLGSYLLYSNQGQAYLSACINPYGTGTVTDQEFKYNRNFYDIRYRLWPWLKGENLKDERCLWAHLSTPLEGDLKAAHLVLEQIWPDWYRWWQAEFPPLYTKKI